jgi:hypothetical protein
MNSFIGYKDISVVTGCIPDCFPHTLNVGRGDRRSLIAPGAAHIAGNARDFSI